MFQKHAMTAKEIYFAKSAAAMAALTVAGTALAATGAGNAATTLNIDDFNKSLADGLATGMEAGKKVTCTGFAAFLGGDNFKYIFAAVLVVMAISGVIVWLNEKNRTQGNGLTRPVMWMIIGFTFIAVVGVLMSQYMGCNTRAAVGAVVN